MTRLCFLLGDQLSDSLPALSSIDPKNDVIFLCEVMQEASYVPHHPKKIAFLFSAMRHFAETLRHQGYRVRYTTLDDPANQNNLAEEIIRAVREESVSELHLTEPGEWRVLEIFERLKEWLSIPIHIFEDTRFLCPISEFKAWASGKKQLRMEYFYRKMRQKYHILIDENGLPVGGTWNLDAENRKNANHIQAFPKRNIPKNDAITEEVLALVGSKFSENFGHLMPFNFAVTRTDALAEAQHFFQTCLEDFGAYQDAMYFGEALLYHSRLSFYLNAGLLMPLELCKMAEDAYFSGTAPLNSVEGFIRQILGWREYVRGIYWLYMPDYAEMNFFGATRPLPDLFWGGETNMACMKEVVRQTSEEAYSHHIQRLMVTGNFALLSGLSPKRVCEWYLAVYADAYEWVELPNTLGMALFADGGLMASKPYAASGKYIQKMSNFCQSCHFNPKDTLGDKACPFNALYWNFISQHEHRLRDNRRMQFAYLNWDKMDIDKRAAILSKASETLGKLDANCL